MTSLQVSCSLSFESTKGNADNEGTTVNVEEKKGNADKEGITVNYNITKINDKKDDENCTIGTVQSDQLFFLDDVTAASLVRCNL